MRRRHGGVRRRAEIRSGVRVCRECLDLWRDSGGVEIGALGEKVQVAEGRLGLGLAATVTVGWGSCLLYTSDAADEMD